MRWWICGDQVVCPALDTGLPDNFFEVGGVDADRSLVFFDGQSVVFRPPCPSETAVWSAENNDWLELPAATIAYTPAWVGLVTDLRGSPLFAKAYAAGDQSLPAQNAFTLLMQTLTVTHNLSDFRFALHRLRAAMAKTEGGDFSEDELGEIAHLLEANGFDPDLLES